MFKDKTFKYFNSNPPGRSAGGVRPHYPEVRDARGPTGPGNGPSQPRGLGAPGSALSQPRPSTQPQRLLQRDSHTAPGPKNRIRVPGNAGDKCVPPVKSRPKKRKSVKGAEENCLSIDKVEWSDNSYTVNQLVREFGERFPLIVKVNQGFYGSCGDLSTQQVLQIHSYGKQKRVLASDDQDRNISLPADYPMDIYVRSGDGGERSRFHTALDIHRLPLTAKVVSIEEDPEFENNSYNLSGEEVKFKSTEESFFLRANSINDGWVDQLDIYVIPSFLGAEFSVAVGMRAATRDEWEDYYGMFARSVRHLNYRMLTGYKGIVVDGQLPSSARTSHVSTAPGGFNLDPVQVSKYQARPEPSPGVTAPTRNMVYENLPESESRRAISVSSSGPSSPVSPTSPVSPGNLPALRVRPYENVQLSGVAREDRWEGSGRDRQGQRSRPGTPHGEADGDTVEEMFASVLSVAKEEEQKRDSLNNRRLQGSFDNPAFIDSNSNQVGTSTPPHYRTPTNYRPQGSLRPEGGEGPPKAVVQPRIQNGSKDTNQFVVTVMIEDTLDRRKEPKISQHPVSYENLNNTRMNGNTDNQIPLTNITSTPSNITSMEDVPTRVEAMTVEDIAKCLTLLNMENHVPQFKKKQVDGTSLSNLSENVMVNEFRLTPFNASKLMRFIRGWRPRFT